MADNIIPFDIGRKPVGASYLPKDIATEHTYTGTFNGCCVPGTRIQEGDKLVAEPNLTPRTGDIVIVREGDRLDVVRFTPADRASVVGVVTFGIYAVRKGGK